MKKTYITPSSVAIDFMVEDQVMLLALSKNETEENVTPDDAMSGKKIWKNSGMWN